MPLNERFFMQKIPQSELTQVFDIFDHVAELKQEK